MNAYTSGAGKGGVESLAWRTSSYSQPRGNCVEWAPGAGSAFVRDSKDRAGGTLVFSERSWSSFVSAIRTGALS
ncbi:DUF397 domain-containing protein [Frankia sp. CcI49]|uniref:DUF397 domain-containing protein n=1 Tax=Parafrankia irregularis TaxID=795642 RepID=A0A0S4QZU3_9ACTN|nr:MULTISPECIES: DUF397 domain-containing protein [Frankiaceae]EFC81532.1 protein of unknown function DUF397 [Parafrankia sp. EUN1f]KPM57418.1 hypothetical protein ACG83_06865 [Frankia sp. R43]MBE3205162.1 DUF397 domain-containing protein [Parafrankia sp. CH37]ONH53588.1 DUF397 domain-containing protein [Frankia sp. CcI49]CUU61163.1 protein of unknown function (DUF397) [Parafrankia irregularis]